MHASMNAGALKRMHAMRQSLIMVLSAGNDDGCVPDGENLTQLTVLA